MKLASPVIVLLMTMAVFETSYYILHTSILHTSILHTKGPDSKQTVYTVVNYTITHNAFGSYPS